MFQVIISHFVHDINFIRPFKFILILIFIILIVIFVSIIHHLSSIVLLICQIHFTIESTLKAFIDIEFKGLFLVCQVQISFSITRVRVIFMNI